MHLRIVTGFRRDRIKNDRTWPTSTSIMTAKLAYLANLGRPNLVGSFLISNDEMRVNKAMQ